MSDDALHVATPSSEAPSPVVSSVSVATDVTIRPARPDDAPFIAQLADAFDMGELSDRGISYVAERKGQPLGFIRLMEDAGIWHVNPVAVDPAAQHQGVGAALMAFAHELYGELRFVARGYAVPFYDALGCEPVPWEAIGPLVAADCDDCPLYPTCHPQPMRMP